MHREQRRRRAEFHDKIAVAYRVHRILSQARKAEQVRHQGAIQRQGRTGQRAAAERADVGAGITVQEPALVAFQHFDISQQMMRQINRLGALQMGVAGDDDIGVFLTEFDQRRLQALNGRLQDHDFLAQPQPHVERDLVIAGAAGVQFGPGRFAAGQGVLDIHVDIFQFLPPNEFARDNFPGDGGEGLFDGARFPGGQHADFFQHGGVGERAEDVVLPKPPIKGDGLGEFRHTGIDWAGEPAAT